MRDLLRWLGRSLVRQIIIAMLLGIAIGSILMQTGIPQPDGPLALLPADALPPHPGLLNVLYGAALFNGTLLVPAAEYFQIPGDFFTKALRAVAPVLVFVLITHAISRHRQGRARGLKNIIGLYIAGTFAAAAVAVFTSTIFPTELYLKAAEDTAGAPENLKAVLTTLLFKITDNPINAVVQGNYIGILTWAILGGVAMRHASDTSKIALDDAARVIHYIVGIVIRIAPYGVFGLVTATVATTGFSTFATYARLVAVLLGSMTVVALLVNPLLVWIMLRKNPYPLVWRCLVQSGIPAFFTRSSAANIPINLNLSEQLGLREETYSISIPLGANINMAGAAITITVLSLAAAHTLHLPVHPLNALILCFLATLGAAGASGVPGGSLMLIPMACSLLGIDGQTAAQVIAIGVLIGVIQDSAETALNSSSDALFTAAADLADRRKDRTGTLQT